MKNKYIDLVEQTFDFPPAEFEVIENELHWHNIPLMDVIEQYGTPLKVTYLPKITSQIERAKKLFAVGMAKCLYESAYHYAYCTKSSHFSFVMDEALKNDIHLETSSAFDINIIRHLVDEKKFNKDQFVICNGFKKDEYLDNIAALIEMGFQKTICVLDNMTEFDRLAQRVNKKCKVGIRIASEEDPKFEFYTSRLGVGYKKIVPFFKEKIKDNPKFELKMLHFFINTGIQDNAYYWNELSKCVSVYCDLKKICPELDSLNIGGGFPIRNSLSFEYDYEYMAEEIVLQVKTMCNARNIKEPHIFTEFGSFTVGESGATFYSIIGQKEQNDRERWSMIDSSFMTTVPDSWALNSRYIMLALNHWDKPYERVLLGGLTCDSQDYYNSEVHKNAIYLPKFDKDKRQYFGFFHTGAYQESIGGYGGIQHCLLPAPKHVLIDEDEHGNFRTKLFAKEQSHKPMMKILGYTS